MKIVKGSRQPAPRRKLVRRVRPAIANARQAPSGVAEGHSEVMIFLEWLSIGNLGEHFL